MSETAPGQTQEQIAGVYSIRTGKLLVWGTLQEPLAQAAAIEPVPEVVVRPVANIRTGKDLERQDVDAWTQSGEMADLVCWSREDLPDNVVPLEDGRLNREVNSLCSSLLEQPHRPYRNIKPSGRLHQIRSMRHPTELL